MPSVTSKFLKQAMRVKQFVRSNEFFTLRNPDAIRAGMAFLLVMGVVGSLILVTRRESSPSRTAVPARAAVNAAQRPQRTDSQASRATASSQAEMKKATDAKTAAAAAASKLNEQKTAIVTVVGCLERQDETFRLKDTIGADVPQSRSWKTVFLKKGPARIEIVDAANRLKLDDHVGERVSMTGTLIDREMQVRSLQRVAESCSKTPQA